MPGFMDSMNSPGGYYALGGVANALSAMQNASAAEEMYSLQTSQLRDQIAYQRKVMEQQVALKEQERVRQQMMAQAAGDAFANSLGQYKDFGGSMDASGGNIADTFRQILSRQAPTSVAPQATGAVADRVENAAQMFNDRSSAEAGNLAKVQALSKALSDKGINVGRNNQLAAMLSNFAGGSQGVSQQEIAAREGRLYQPNIIKPAPSMLGDLVFSLGMGGMLAANQKKPEPQGSFMGLQLPGSNVIPGTNIPSYGVGLKMPGNLGISSPRMIGE